MKNSIVSEVCAGCGICISVCPVDAIQWNGNVPVISDKCTQCHKCVEECPVGAIVKF